MKIEIEFISRSMVKPSSPTPDHLRRCQFSSLDQLMTPLFTTWLLFYPRKANMNNTKSCRVVKESLSEILTLYRPLAGRIRDNMYIDCNDEGVHFVEAKAMTCTISDFLQNNCCNELNKLLPSELDGSSTDHVAFVQVTYLACGGLVVGLGLSHKIADGLSAVMFLTSWAAIARGDRTKAVVPRFDAAEYFPPINISGFDPSLGVHTNKDQIVLKRFVFCASNVAALRDKYVYNSGTGQPIRPTRAEALTTFIWSRFMASTQSKGNNDEKIYAVHHMLNLRPRMSPPLSGHHFGNFVVEPLVAVPDLDAADGNYGIVSQMRDTIRNVDMDYIKVLQQGDAYLNMMKERADRAAGGEATGLFFTDCSRFEYYETDFGWGKPVWLGIGNWPYNNFILFFATKEGNGIEAYIHMKVEDMAKFEKDDEVAAFVSPIPHFNKSAL